MYFVVARNNGERPDSSLPGTLNVSIQNAREGLRLGFAEVQQLN